jgi:hypothetical protein
VIARIPVGHDPRGLTLSRNGSRLFVANRLEDTISVIDTRSNARGRDDYPRRAEDRLRDSPRRADFLYLALLVSGQIGCANCHIDSTFDGITWDLEPDGFGRDIVDNKMLEDIKDTEPYKWNGGNPNIPTECGPRTEKYFWRSENYDNLTLADLAIYIRSLPTQAQSLAPAGGELTPAQERGKAIFERAVDKFGKPIPEYNRCSYCHSGPKGTNQKLFDVGTRKPTTMAAFEVAAVDRTLRSPRPTCTTARRARWKRSGPSTTPTTSTAAPTT